MNRRDFVKKLPFLPVALLGVLLGKSVEAKESHCKHEPLLWKHSPYPIFSFRDAVTNTEQEIFVCKHCSVVYGTERVSL